MNIRCLGIACTVLMLAGPVFAHHGFGVFDYGKEVTIVGELKELQWTNPHIHLLINVANGRGGVTEWDVEAGTTGAMQSAGWSRDVIKPGEKISVLLRPMKNGTKGGQLMRARRADGTGIGGPYYTLALYGVEIVVQGKV